MNFWRRDLRAEPEKTRADVIIQKKRRKQDPEARGLGAVAIPRIGTRSIHQRNEDRHVLEKTFATAVIEGEQHEIRVLNLSSNGVMIGYDGKLSIGQAVRIAIEECAPITAAVRWIQHERVGLEFAAETVIIADAGVQDFIIKTIARERRNDSYKPSFTVGAEQRGAEKRHQLVWVGRLCWNDRDATVRLRNISKTGAMIALANPCDLKDGDKVQLRLEEAESVAARVSWSAGDQFGLQFEEEFDVAKLVAIACAELANESDGEEQVQPNSEPGEEESASDIEADDFTSLRVRLAKRGDASPKPSSIYTRLSLDEVYQALHGGERDSAPANHVPEAKVSQG